MNRKLSLALLLALLLTFNGTAAFAAGAEGDPEPSAPVAVTDDDSAEDTVYFPSDGAARGALSSGTITLEVGGHLIASGSGATFANQKSSIIRFTMRLYKYDTNSGTSTYLDYQTFWAYEAYHCAGAYNFNVPTTGYYFLVGIHAIGSEQQNTQTSAVYIY